MRTFFKDIYTSNKKNFIKILIWNLISGVMSGVGIVMLIPMLSALDISTEQTGILATFISKFAGLPRTQTIVTLLVIYFSLVILKALIGAKLSIWNTELVQGYTKELRMQFYDAVSHADWQKFKTYKKSELSNYFINEIGRISYTINVFIGLIQLIIVTVVNVVIALLMSIRMTLFVMFMGILFLIISRGLRRKSKVFGEKMQKISESFFEEINNQMSGIKEFRSYGIEKKQYKKFEDVAGEYKNILVDYTKLMAFPNVLLTVISTGAVVVLFLVAYLGLHMTLGRIAVIVYVMGRLIPSFTSLQNYFQQLNTTLPVYQKMRTVVKDLSDSRIEIDIVAENFEFKDRIDFREISFSYADSNVDDLIECANFTLNKGEITAFVGRSGAGKTTLVDIVLGFLQPGSGEIYVDGHLMDKQGYASFCKGVSYIPQEPLLLNASIRENLLCFRPDATEEDMIDALTKAQVLKTVNNLPDKLDTVIGNHGIRLSGGERQRIVLARALIGRPKLLVMDEATSSLDYENEKKIRNILISLKGELTVLLVAHRLSTIQSAEHIIVIENGVITEDGSYSELVQNTDGYLGRMVNE